MPAPDDVAAKRPPQREETMHLMRFIRLDISRVHRRFRTRCQCGGARLSAGAGNPVSGHDPRHRQSQSGPPGYPDVEERGFAGNRLKVLLNRPKEMGTPDLDGIEKSLGRRWRCGIPERLHVALRRLLRRTLSAARKRAGKRTECVWPVRSWRPRRASATVPRNRRLPGRRAGSAGFRFFKKPPVLKDLTGRGHRRKPE